MENPNSRSSFVGKLGEKAKETNYRFFPKRDSPKKSKSQNKLLFSKKQIQEEQIDLKFWNLGEAQRQFFRLYTASSHNIKQHRAAKPRVKSSTPMPTPFLEK